MFLRRIATAAAYACALTATGAETPDAGLATFDPTRRVDLEATAFASTPERFSFCIAPHPGRPVEIDVCLNADASLVALTSHVFYRKRWSFEHGEGGTRGLVIALGPGVGGRVMFFCPFKTCVVGGGPEALLSFEAVEWLSTGLGLTLQLDGGLAVVWMAAAPGVVDRGYRFPVRLLVGVAF